MSKGRGRRIFSKVVALAMGDGLFGPKVDKYRLKAVTFPGDRY